MLGSSCISWLSKKQPTMATSSCEAEYRAAFIAMVECVWRLVADLGVGQPFATTTIFTNSQSALVVARNPQCSMLTLSTLRCTIIMLTLSTLRCTIIMSGRGSLRAGEINLAYVPTPHDDLADLFTKALPLVRSSKLFAKLWAYFLLWIDHSPYSMALPYTL